MSDAGLDGDRVGAGKLADEFGSVQVRQTDSGAVWVRVEDIYKPSEDATYIIVECRTPNGDTFVERFDEPKTWDMSNAFVRFVRRNDYDATSFEHLVGDEVQAEYTDDGWQLKRSQVDPENYGFWRIGAGIGVGLAFVVAVLAGLGLLMQELLTMLPF